jgi:hypothetical protein
MQNGHSNILLGELLVEILQIVCGDIGNEFWFDLAVHELFPVDFAEEGMSAEFLACLQTLGRITI